jgi:hypothetical protein
MHETLAIIRQRFVKGLRESRYEFIATIIVAGRGIRFSLNFIAQHLAGAMAEAREKAASSGPRHK